MTTHFLWSIPYVIYNSYLRLLIWGRNRLMNFVLICWLFFCSFFHSLRSKRFQSRVIRRKLERKQKKGWRGRGRGEEERGSFFPLPLPCHSCLFLLLCQLSRRTSRGNACYAGYSPPPPLSFMFFLLLSQLSRRTSRGNACYAGYFFQGRQWNLGWLQFLPDPLVPRALPNG